MKKIFITGATGFVGTEILKTLVSQGFSPIALVRDESKLSFKKNVEIVKGDIFEPQKYQEALSKSDAVIHLIGIIRENRKKGITFEKLHFEATKIIVDEVRKTNIKRFIHMSANGARENAVSNYHITKYKAEQYVENSGLTYTIFKPSVIYGPKDSFINMLNDIMKKTPIFSYFGKGDYILQPISVFEVANIFCKSITEEKTFNKKFTLCGKKVLTYKELLKLILKITGKKRILLPIPEFFIDIGISLFGNFQWFPITRDQFIMLKEGNKCEDSSIFEILNLEQKDIEAVLQNYLR